MNDSTGWPAGGRRPCGPPTWRRSSWRPARGTLRSPSRVHDAAQAGGLQPAHADRRAYCGVPRARADEGRVATPPQSSAPLAPRWPTSYPAVLEAAHAGVRLVVVTADRPARLRGTGANQTTDQVDVYGDASELTLDVAKADPTSCPGSCASTTRRASGPPQRPARRPAAARRGVASCAGPRTVPSVTLRDPPRRVELDQGPRTVVVAGDDAGPPARVLAESGRLAALRRAVQRLPHGRRRDPHLPPPARR